MDGPATTAVDVPASKAVRNPLSLIRVNTAMARIAAAIGIVFLIQSLPIMLEQLPNMDPVWNWTVVGSMILALLACAVAAILRRFVVPTFAVFAAVYLVALVSWPFAVEDVEVAASWASSFWLYFLLTIATGMAAVSLDIPIAVVYTIGAPVLYGLIRVTPPGGSVDPVLAVLDSVYSILLGGAILILIAVLRYAATGVDTAQQNALERYSHAVRHHATEAERVQVDSIVHDSVLTTLLSAARATTRDAKALAATMAADAIGILERAMAEGPEEAGTVQDGVVAARIADAAAAMSHPFEVRTSSTGRTTLTKAAAEALYSAAVQAMVNSLQHAGPGVKRWVEFASDDQGRVRVEIGDRGRGFDPGAVPNERLGVRVSIVERVASAGGRAEVIAAPGQGTRIVLTWPDASAQAHVVEFDIGPEDAAEPERDGEVAR